MVVRAIEGERADGAGALRRNPVPAGMGWCGDGVSARAGGALTSRHAGVCGVCDRSGGVVVVGLACLTFLQPALQGGCAFAGGNAQQEMFNADFLVQVWPVNTFAIPDEAKIPALFRCAVNLCFVPFVDQTLLPSENSCLGAIGKL